MTELNQDELEILWIGATRYYLGRVDKEFALMLERAWPDLPKLAQTLIRRDVEQAFTSYERLQAQGVNTHPLPGEAECTAVWQRVRALWGGRDVGDV